MSFEINWDLLKEVLAEDDFIILHNLDDIDARINLLKGSFPQNSVHTFAVKSNPLIEILKLFVTRGFGLECASIEEVWLSIEAGCPPNKILHDGPAKTVSEISFCLEKGVGLIANDTVDLQRIGGLIQQKSSLPENNHQRIGIRINPLVGEGRISATSVTTSESKFGVILDGESGLVNLLSDYNFVNGVHLHVGSQGTSLNQLTEGINRVLKEIDRLPTNVRESLDWVDIGGGIPVNYDSGGIKFDFSEISDNISWFTNKFPNIEILTEYGRSLISNSGLLVSKIEKRFEREGIQHVILHAGADAFLRWAYKPEDWWHRVSFQYESKEKIPTLLHGPLCFSGDTLGGISRRSKAIEGSLLSIHDVGAYVISLWSHHCNRRRPRIVGIRNYSEPIELLPRDTREDIIKLWNIRKS